MRALIFATLLVMQVGLARPAADMPLAGRFLSLQSLRGGATAEEQAAQESRMQACLDRLKSVTCELQSAIDEGEDKDLLGHTSGGEPLSINPTNAVVYNPDEYSSEATSEVAEETRRQERLAPTAEGIASAMQKVEWIRDVVDRLSPANVIKGLEDMGHSLEDLQPRMHHGSAGTEMGNLTRILETRERMKQKIQQIEATKDLLVQEMKKTSPVDELNKELADMRESGRVNPYIKLLHEWQKQHEIERETGSLQRQGEALKEVAMPAGPVRSEPRPSAPIAVGDERSRLVAGERDPD